MVNWRQMIWIGIVFLVAACGGTRTAELPTRVFIPTNTPTDTPVPSATPTDTPVPTATPTLTATPTTTRTPTNTPPPTSTPLPSNTPTHTVTPSPSRTPTPLATNTPVATPTPNTPTIRLFQANVTTARPGETVRLRWEAQADGARLERLDGAGNLLENNAVNLVGSTTATVPQGVNTIIYRLVAIRGASETRQSVTINVQVACSPSWFFPNPSPEIGCPSADPASVPLAYQTFERGVMFRIQVNTLDRVCGIQRDSNRNLYSCYGYQDFTGAPPETPPATLQAPGVPLQHTFYNTLALGGPWYTVIGWATAPLNTTTAPVQFDSEGRLYTRLPDGQVYRFDGQLNQTFQQVTILDTSTTGSSQ